MKQQNWALEVLEDEQLVPFRTENSSSFHHGNQVNFSIYSPNAFVVYVEISRASYNPCAWATGKARMFEVLNFKEVKSVNYRKVHLIRFLETLSSPTIVWNIMCTLNSLVIY